jgi:hypothetical protein
MGSFGCRSRLLFRRLILLGIEIDQRVPLLFLGVLDSLFFRDCYRHEVWMASYRKKSYVLLHQLLAISERLGTAFLCCFLKQRRMRMSFLPVR